jgi:hypothetical protein
MSKVRILLVAAALLTAACAGGATLSGSKNEPATNAGYVQVNGGANAGSDLSDITNRPNPPVHKGGTAQARPVTPQNAAPAAPQPAFGTGTDRCGSGVGTSGAGNRESPTGQPKHPPLPMCAVE